MEQPIPDVTEADVDRVLRRDFAAQDAAQVKSWLRVLRPPLAPRVALAVLKLADGSLEGVRLHLELARRDWRDVIVGAEYPVYMERVSRGGDRDKDRLREIIQADWKQYSAWLQR